MEQYKPQDATTNPSLILKAAILPEYASLLTSAVDYGNGDAGKGLNDTEKLDLVMDRLAVNFGAEISKIVPGYVSTEVDARLSFDTVETVNRARRIISMYEELGIPKTRILIKIASTYEGIRAGEILEKEGITCNLTLLFSLVQAAACAEANITLISPFVGRILDWYKKSTGDAYSDPTTDPGVISVKQIYNYYKKFQYNTIVMGASFRNTGEIMSLAGCDRLTIAPKLLGELEASNDHVTRVLINDQETASKAYTCDKLDVSEKSFRYLLNSDAMATEKLAEGIRGFAKDIITLENIVKSKM
jgi:transaldolase